LGELFACTASHCKENLNIFKSIATNILWGHVRAFSRLDLYFFEQLFICGKEYSPLKKII